MKRDSISVVAEFMAIAMLIGVAFFLTFFVAISSAEETKVKDEKSIFVKEKCAECHSMKALGIKKEVSGESADDAPDLSGVGTKRTAEWISKWLMKKEAIDGVKHEKKFKGNSEALDTLSKWLATMKAAPQNGK